MPLIFYSLLNQHCWLASLQYGALQPLILYIFTVFPPRKAEEDNNTRRRYKK
ncbi:Uncharacterised protein [Escherichia coli]|uniref:Uncharacterized protein n=1 Tax=Escherichia coli TaxID=562 RepID=A0A377AGH1_ECOLX|nr:Uncharacterised protein [Escherichia coli]